MLRCYVVDIIQSPWHFLRRWVLKRSRALKVEPTWVSSIVGQVIEYYRSLTSLFNPFERLFSIRIPNYVRDMAVFWVISGAIGARTTLWFNRKLFDLADSVVKKAESDPESSASLNKGWGRKPWKTS